MAGPVRTYGCDLTRWNTFGMNVKCSCFVEYSSEEELREVLADIASGDLPQPVLHIGEGSNLLFTGDFPGTVLHSRISFIEEENGLIHVGAGVRWDDFCEWCARRGLWGPENLSLIPGETGSAAVQNIGAYGVEAKDLIREVRCMDTGTMEIVTVPRETCGYAYRDSIFKGKAKGRYVVLSVIFDLSRFTGPCLDYAHLRSAVQTAGLDEAEITPMQMRRLIISIRQSKLPDPSVIGSAGSFFRNPVVSEAVYDNICAQGYNDVPHYFLGLGMVKIPAAWLIEQCGWKGYRAGNAGVYEKQPLVIVNLTGKARPEEILELEHRIISSVQEKFGIKLSPEVEHI